MTRQTQWTVVAMLVILSMAVSPVSAIPTPVQADSVTPTTSLSCDPVSGAGFTYTPGAPRVGALVTFTATVAAGTPPITYRWDYGDGGIDVGPVVANIFPITNALQTYTTTLTASNTCGSGTSQAQKLVTVSPYRTYLPILFK